VFCEDSNINNRPNTNTPSSTDFLYTTCTTYLPHFNISLPITDGYSRGSKITSEMSQTSTSSWPVDGLWGLDPHGLRDYHVPHPCPKPVSTDTPLDLRQRGLTDKQLLDGRAYACHNCLRDGGKAFSVAYNDYDRHVWGVDEPGRQHHGLPTPEFGCSCGKSCHSHRLARASNWVNSTVEVRNWMNKLWGAKVCPFCMSYPKGESPVDAYGFKGNRGGEDLPQVVYVCLSCQDIVIIPREVGMGPIPDFANTPPAPPTAHLAQGTRSTRNMGTDGGCSSPDGTASSRNDSPSANDDFADQFAAGGIWGDVAAAQNRTPSPLGITNAGAAAQQHAEVAAAYPGGEFDDMMGFDEDNLDSAGSLLDLYGDLRPAGARSDSNASPEIARRSVTPGQGPQPVTSPTPSARARHSSSPAGFADFGDFVNLSPSPPAAVSPPEGPPGAGGEAPVSDALAMVFAELDEINANRTRLASNPGASDAGGDVAYYGDDQDAIQAGWDNDDDVWNQSLEEAGSAGEEEVVESNRVDSGLSWVPSPPSMSWTDAHAELPAPSMVPPPQIPAPASGRMTPAEAVERVQRVRDARAAEGRPMTAVEEQLLYTMVMGVEADDSVLQAAYPLPEEREPTPAPTRRRKRPEEDDDDDDDEDEAGQRRDKRQRTQPPPPAAVEQQPEQPRRGRGHPAGSRNVNRGGIGSGPAAGRAVNQFQPARPSPLVQPPMVNSGHRTSIAPNQNPAQPAGYLPYENQGHGYGQPQPGPAPGYAPNPFPPGGYALPNQNYGHGYNQPQLAPAQAQAYVPNPPARSSLPDNPMVAAPQQSFAGFPAQLSAPSAQAARPQQGQLQQVPQYGQPQLHYGYHPFPVPVQPLPVPVQPPQQQYSNQQYGNPQYGQGQQYGQQGYGQPQQFLQPPQQYGQAQNQPHSQSHSQSQPPNGFGSDGHVSPPRATSCAKGDAEGEGDSMDVDD
jgi:hypothetical protein